MLLGKNVAYILSDLITELQTKAKDSSLSQTLLTQFLNDAQELILGNQTYSFMEKQPPDTTLSIGQTTAAYPADQQISIDLVLIDPVIQTNVTTLDYVPAEVFFDLYPNPPAMNAGKPTAWTDFGRQIYFNIPAGSAYTFRHRYLRRPITLVNGTDVPDVPAGYRNALIYLALGAIEEYRDNFAFASSYFNKADGIMEDMAVRLAVRQLGEPTDVFTNSGLVR